jgi:predicted DNA-binding transcriptional regulator AlpA
MDTSRATGGAEFIRYPELRPRYGIPYSFEHCCRLAAAGKFPPKLKLSYKCVGWLAADIERWLASRVVEPAGGSS